MIRRFSINFALFSMLLDGSLVACSLWLSAWLRPKLNQLPSIEFILSPVMVPPLLYFFFPLIWIFVYFIISIYDGKKYTRAIDEFTTLLVGMLISSISTAGILYFSYRDVSRAQYLLFVLLAYFSHFLWRIAIRIFLSKKEVFLDPLRHVLVVGIGSLGEKVREQLLVKNPPNLKFIGFVDHAEHNLNSSSYFLGNSESIVSIINSYQISDVVIALPHSQYYQMGEIVQKLEKTPVQVWIALGFFDLALYKTQIEDFAGIPMLDLRASAIDDYQKMTKRAFDIVLTFFILILALPFISLSALLIYFDDGHPVLFRQKRVGENGKLFEMLKFRTMVKDAEQLRELIERKDEKGNIIHKSKNDPRITRIGSFLRRFSLDELPQLINVLRGEMSLVGPRPEIQYLVESYQPWQRKRFAVPPGLTGWWQVSGRSDKPMHLHTEDDLYYIQNYSIWLDIQILIRTIWVVVNGRGSY